MKILKQKLLDELDKIELISFDEDDRIVRLSIIEKQEVVDMINEVLK